MTSVWRARIEALLAVIRGWWRRRKTVTSSDVLANPHRKHLNDVPLPQFLVGTSEVTMVTPRGHDIRPAARSSSRTLGMLLLSKVYSS